MVSPSKGEVREFNAELADFTDSWLGRTEVDELQTVCSIFENPEFEEALKLYKAEGHDLGVGVFASMSEDELHQYLGYRNGLPLGFRCYTHAEHEKIPYQLDADTPFDGCDKVVLSWHQLVFVAAVFTHMSNSKQAALEGILHSPVNNKTPDAIKEEWAKTPGLCLLDEVGLGKTISCMATIVTLRMIHELDAKRREKNADTSKMPACVKDGEHIKLWREIHAMCVMGWSNCGTSCSTRVWRTQRGNTQ